MVIMALDHVRMWVTRSHPSEFWGTPLPVYDGDGVAFLTRLVTHICAPGFCFLMGMGMALLVQRRADSEDWSHARIARYFVTRGGVLILVQHLIENPAWLLGGAGSAIEVEHYGLLTIPGAGDDVWLHFGVLYMLGAVMLVWGLLLWLPRAAIAVLSLFALAVPTLFLPDASAAAEAHGAGLNLLFVPGRSGLLQVYYPLVPWFGVAGLGILLGTALEGDRARSWRWPLVAAPIALAGFVVLRVVGVGDHHPVGEGWIGFLNVTKYPPSPAYLLLTLSVIWGILGLFGRFVSEVPKSHPLLVFGQTALGFYVAHLYFYALVGWAFPRGTSFALMYAVWIAGLVPLYFVSRWWRGYKATKGADSLWRML